MEVTPIPAPPTDDLWKFCAITGVWVLFGLSVLVLFTIYVVYASNDRLQEVTQHSLTSSYVRCLSTRIDELRSNEHMASAPCVIRDHLEAMDLETLEHFKDFASEQLPAMEKELAKNQSNTYFLWLTRAYVYTWLPFALIVVLVLTCICFWRWAKSQIISSEMRDLDLKIKTKQLRILELEEAKRLPTNHQPDANPLRGPAPFSSSVRLRMLRRLLTNNVVMAMVSIVLLACGLVLGVVYRNFMWVNRFGALVICSGIIITARPVILRQVTRSEILDEDGISFFDNEHYKNVGEPVPEWLIQERLSRAATGWLGPGLVFIGTLATGFGDLLNKVAGFGAT